MTCLMSRICAKADGCNIHDRYTLEKCSAFKEKQNNFSRITATPEALAEFLSDTCCRLLRDVWSNDGETGEGYWQEDESEWLNWLKQESE